MKLSIGIPTYNQADYLEACILSCLNQDVSAYEIVVSNNHCTDRTEDILKSFGEQIKVVKPDTHLTMMQNWNFCVSNCSGDWFSLLSSDDLALPIFTQSFVDGGKKYGDAVFLRAGWQNIDIQGEILRDRYLLSVKGWIPSREAFLSELNGPKASFAAFAVKKEAWEIVGGFPESLELYGDWGLWLRLTQVGGFGYIHKLVSQYRVWDRDDRSFKARCLKIIQDELFLARDVIEPISKTFDKKVQNLSRSALKDRQMRLFSLISEKFKLEEIQELKAALIPYAEFLSTIDKLDNLLSGNLKTSKIKGRSLLANSKLVRAIYEPIKKFQMSFNVK